MKLKYRNFVLFLLSISWILPFNLNSEEIASEVRGIWLSRSVISQGRESIHSAFQELKHLGINTVFVNTWYKGKTIYPSQVLEDYGLDNQLDEYGGWDPLKVAIEEGEKIGIKVHAWFEYGLVGGYAYSSTNDPKPTGIPAKYPDWLMKNREGDPYYTGDSYNFQYWIDPASSDGIEYMAKVFEECAQKYPDLDGIQTDRFRYPGPDYSFSDISRSKYQEDTNGSDPINITKGTTEWDQFTEWREKQVSNLADTVYTVIKNANPDCIVSSAVVPPYMMSGDSDKMQEWPDWYKNGSIDWLSPMLYGLHTNMDYWINQCLNLVPSSKILLPGFSLNNISNSDLENLIQISRQKNCGGQVIWYYGYLNAQNKPTFLEQYDEILPTIEDKIIIDNSDDFYTDYSNMTISNGGYNGNYYNGTGGDSWFQWNIPVFNSGEYRLSTYVPDNISLNGNIKYQISINNENFDTTLSIDNSSNLGSWQELSKFNIDFNDSLVVKALNQSTEVFADAVKFEKIMPLNIINGFAPNANTLIIQFDRGITRNTAKNISNYSIQPEIQINNIQVDNYDSSIVHLNCESFQESIQYQLKTWSQKSANGYISDTVKFDFQYHGETTKIIDNDDNFFTIQSGNWIEENIGNNIIGNSYLKIPCGEGDNIVYWRYQTPETGYYKVWLYFPDSSQYASDAEYIIRKSGITDTLNINQQIEYPEGYSLESFWMEEGDNLVVILSDKSECSTDQWIVADAIKVKRVLPTEIEDSEKQRRLVEDFELYQNYPNPFNSATIIPYRLPEKGDVNLKIYDLQGRIIKNINKEGQSSGYNRFDLNMDKYPSGLYFYKMTVNGHSKVGKMSYLK